MLPVTLPLRFVVGFGLKHFRNPPCESTAADLMIPAAEGALASTHGSASREPVPKIELP
jgi:hypothetical protein